MAKFESEWRGKGRGGKDLARDEDIYELTDQAAKAIRLFMMQTRIDEPVWLKTMQGVVMQELGVLTPSSARKYRLLMQTGFGFIKTEKEEEGRRWLVSLTDRGVDFLNWLIQDPDGQKWGIKSKVDLSAEEKRRYEEAFIRGSSEADREGGGGGLVEIKGGVVKWQLGQWGLLLDERVPRYAWGKIMAAVTKRSMRTVFVPDGYEVYVAEVTGEGTGRGGKRKLHRVTRWSEFPVVDRQLIMDNEVVDDESAGGVNHGDEEQS